MGWLSPLESKIIANPDDGKCGHKFCIDVNEMSWLAAILVAGASVSGLTAGFLMSRFGRKGALLVYISLLLNGWLLVTFAVRPWMWYIGRFLKGLGAGGGFATVSIYIGEISKTSIRGRLIGLVQVHFAFGLLLSYLLGYFYSIFVQNFVSLAIASTYCVALLYVPESPYYLVSLEKAPKLI